MVVVDGNRTLVMSPAEYEEWKWVSGEKKAVWT